MPIPNDMLDKAMDVLKNAYAPYSHFLVGACLRSETNQLFVGCNVENASYSLALCAEACALAALISNGCKQIKEVLVITDIPQPAPPCGSCRQRLFEFANANTMIHLCNLEGAYKAYTLIELLPHPFTRKSMERK